LVDLTRSYEPILATDLHRLGKIAQRDRRLFFARNPKYSTLCEHVVAVALCQGAALHYVDGRNGIKDLDVWTFYAALKHCEYPPRRPVASYDLGISKFGRTRNFEHFTGRKVDCLGRSISVSDRTDPRAALRDYLRNARTRSAEELARKAVVMIEPSQFLGEVVWPL
jgi:hypothetical protein